MMISVSSLKLVGLLQETIIVQGLSLNIAHIILSTIFSMVFIDFDVRGLKSTLTPLLIGLREFFFHADNVANAHSLLG